MLSTIEAASADQRANARKQRIIFINFDCMKPVIYKRDIAFKISPEVQKKLQDAGFNPLALENAGTYDVLGMAQINPTHVEQLLKLCEKHQAQIVVCASGTDKTPLQATKAKCALTGLHACIHDITPTEPKDTDQIKAWLYQHGHTVQSFVILHKMQADETDPLKEHWITRCADNPFTPEQLGNIEQRLSNPFPFDSSPTALKWKKIAQNSEDVNEIIIDPTSLFYLRLHLQRNEKDCLEHIEKALSNNTHIKHLTIDHLLNIYDSKTLLTFIVNLLRQQSMPLERISLPKNGFTDLALILEFLDGDQCHIPHLCLNHNPIRNQEQLAQWIQSYPKKIHIDLVFAKECGGHVHLGQGIIKAILDNKNVTATVQDYLIEETATKEAEQTYKEGRLTVEQCDRGWLKPSWSPTF